jgi:saccharopine dehydrogenase-like NADP-dependent oxidoreductase
MGKKVLVIGSGGMLGKYVVEKAILAFGIDKLAISDYKEKRLRQQQSRLGSQFAGRPSARLIDVHSQESIRKGLQGVALVIIALQQKEPSIQQQCMALNIPSLDLSVDPGFLTQALALEKKANHQQVQLLTAGLFPGLSGILAKELGQRSQTSEPVQLGLLQSTQGSNGKTGVADMLRILDQAVEWLSEGASRSYPGFTHKREFAFPPPLGSQALRLANFVERNYLKREGILSNYWTAFDKESFNLMIRLLKRLGFLSFFHTPKTGAFLGALFSKENKGKKHEYIGLCAQTAEEQVSMVLTSDYEATAACAIAFAKKILTHKPAYPGIRFPFELFTLQDILDELQEVIVDMKIGNR